MSKNIEITIRNQIAMVALNRPEIRNAFDDTLIAELTKTFRRLDADKSVRAVVLMGNGPAFCAGADLNWMKRMAGYNEEQNLEDARALAAMLRTLDRLGKPTMRACTARLSRAASACRGLRHCSEHRGGVLLTEVKLGLTPATISPYVVRAMGERAARRYSSRASASRPRRPTGLACFRPAQPGELDNAINALLGHIVWAAARRKPRSRT